MSEPEPLHPIDALVRRHLMRQAGRADAVAMLRRVRPAALPARRPRARRALFGLAAAAALLMAFLGGRQAGPAQAAPDSLVREARAAAALPVDRCYLVQSVTDPASPLARHPVFGQPRIRHVWTRGDRFFVQSTNPAEKQCAWGQDDQGRVWLSLNRRLGVVYDPGEPVPEPVASLRDVYTMQVPTLLDQVLAGFDLERVAGDTNATVRVVARPRHRGRPWISRAVLDLDAESRVLRRLVLHRTTGTGAPFVTVTYTLVDTTPQPDEKYRLEGHLGKRAELLTPTRQSWKRDAVLQNFFWPPPPKPKPLPMPMRMPGV